MPVQKAEVAGAQLTMIVTKPSHMLFKRSEMFESELIKRDSRSYDNSGAVPERITAGVYYDPEVE